jgi:EAL domain-containing protein (putative c-di-GMP-specific phosphodiesterase class I)/CHASE2 domain-containing sensor protein
MRVSNKSGETCSVRTRDQKLAERSPWWLLLWTAVAGLIFGLAAFGEPLEDALRSLRNTARWHKASGDIVLVRIDNSSLRELGEWPWPRTRYAELTDRLTESGARRIFFNLPLNGPTQPAADRAFSEALERSGRSVLAFKLRSGPNSQPQLGVAPYGPFAAHADLASTNAQYNFQNAVWRIESATRLDGHVLPSLSTMLAGAPPQMNSVYTVDYSIDPSTIPAFSAHSVINRRIADGELRGKDVVVSVANNVAGDEYFIPGTGKMDSAYVHILGAETLKEGRPVNVGWLPMFLAALVMCGLTLRQRNAGQQGAILGGSVAAILGVSAFLEARLIFADITPALFALSIIAGVLVRRSYRRRGLINTLSGLPNLNALQANRAGREQALIVARVTNFAEVCAALPEEAEQQLVEQIISRLNLGSKNRTLYQGDGGIFAWFENGDKPIGHHIEALYTLFRNPVRVAGMSVDLSVSFGVEIGSGRSLANRLSSALVAADEAAHDGLKWKYHDPGTFEDASWKLSMLSQLDSAIDKGEVWIAFQPQLDLKTRKIVGAEALARWTHPDKGPIAASEFVAAAEQHDRIGKLTDFVLEKAIAAAASINQRGLTFGVAVNLSARLLSDRQFSMRVAALLARHGLEPKHLTLELTETIELADGGDALAMLSRLRDLGVEISIDDYGTGLSTLDYLKKIPANEIKIDQSFVKGLCDNRSDRLMVHSTIGLAHSLGRKVVAEGVEEREILDALAEMECDMAQGYVVGRPMSLESLLKRLASDRQRNVA